MYSLYVDVVFQWLCVCKVRLCKDRERKNKGEDE